MGLVISGLIQVNTVLTVTCTAEGPRVALSIPCDVPLTEQIVYLHQHMLLPFVFHPHILNFEGSVPKRQILEVNLLDQARRLVLLHQWLHSLLHRMLKLTAVHLQVNL